MAGEFPPMVGGLAKSAARVVGFLVDAGCDVSVVVPVDENSHIDTTTAVPLNGCQIYWAPVEKNVTDGFGSSLSKFLMELDQKQNFDVFHAFWFSLTYPASIAIASKNKPLIASIRGSDAHVWTAPKLQRLRKSVLKKVSVLTSVNSHLLDIVAENDFQGKTKIITNSICVDGVAKWKLSECKRGMIGTVATFRPVKEIPVLVTAYSQIPASNRNGLMLIGYFKDEYANEKLRVDHVVEQYGLNDEIVLTGKQTPGEVLSRLLDLHVFVMTSKTEGFPNALLEAASLGVPIVTTAFEGIEDYITDDDSALLVPVGDASKVAEAINMILEDDVLANKLSAGAMRLAAKFRPESERESWLSLYEQVFSTETN